LTFEASRDRALVSAQEALIGCLSEDLDRGLDLPTPSLDRLNPQSVLIPIPLRLSVALLLKRFRREKDWTTRDVAKRLGVTRQAYEKLERGLGNPSVGTMERTLAIFGKRADLAIFPCGVVPGGKKAA
jgi:DNA-binding XRE family transcriptional regulator